MTDNNQWLLQVSNLRKYFPVRRGVFGAASMTVKAVDSLNFNILRGETLGLVGESGSGKTTAGRVILRAIEPTAGKVSFQVKGGDIVDFTALKRRDLRSFRIHAQMIFQDPYSSLSPRMTVRDIIAEPLVVSKNTKRTEIDERVRDVALRCHLNIEHLRRYPHAFSGGQRQRIGIARALILNPEFIICDEPVSALDVSIQAQVLNLLKELQSEFKLTYLFIAHDLSVVKHISDRVAVMYLGRLVELAPTETLFHAPMHPYTEALMSAIPVADPDKPMQPVVLEGEIPNPADPPSGCHFHPRCLYAEEQCRIEVPEWIESRPNHFIACHLADKLHLDGVG